MRIIKKTVAKIYDLIILPFRCGPLFPFEIWVFSKQTVLYFLLQSTAEWKYALASCWVCMTSHPFVRLVVSFGWWFVSGSNKWIRGPFIWNFELQQILHFLFSQELCSYYSRIMKWQYGSGVVGSQEGIWRIRLVSRLFLKIKSLIILFYTAKLTFQQRGIYLQNFRNKYPSLQWTCCQSEQDFEFRTGTIFLSMFRP